MLVTSFDAIRKYISFLIDDFAICQALADPRNSQELTEFVQDIVHNETSSLMREHNDVIEMQRDEINKIRSEIRRLQHERMENINAHATEVLALHGAHAVEIQGLHGAHAVEIQGLHGEYTHKIKNARAIQVETK